MATASMHEAKDKLSEASDKAKPHPFAFYSPCYFSSIFHMRLECLGSTSLYALIKK